MNTAPHPETEKSNGLGVASMVLGIIGLVLFWIPILPYPFAILAIIFGAIGRKNTSKKGFAISGLVTGIVSLILNTWVWISIAFFI